MKLEIFFYCQPKAELQIKTNFLLLQSQTYFNKKGKINHALICCRTWDYWKRGEQEQNQGKLQDESLPDLLRNAITHRIKL